MNSKTSIPKKVIALTFIEDAVGESSAKVFRMHEKTNLASYKLQLHPALMACQALGHKVELWSLHNTHPEHLNLINNPSLVIVGKMSSNNESSVHNFTMINLSVIARMRRKKVPIAVIYSDHHCHREDAMGEFYRDILSLANHIICPTPKLIELLQQSISEEKKYHLIKDPWNIESTKKYKSKNNAEDLNLIWFGSASNAIYLAKLLPDLIKSVNTQKNINLTILSSKIGNTIISEAVKCATQGIKDWRIKFVQWLPQSQPEQLTSELEKAHMTLLPSNPNDPSKTGVSHNRFVDAVRGGTIPIASPMCSYLEYIDLGIIGNDFVEMIERAELNYEQYTAKFDRHRDSMLSEHCPKINQKNWRNLINNIT